MTIPNFLLSALAFMLIVGCGTHFELRRASVVERIGSSNIRRLGIGLIVTAVIWSTTIALTGGPGTFHALISFAFIPLAWILSKSPDAMRKKQHLSQDDVIVAALWPMLAFLVIEILDKSNIYEMGTTLRLLVVVVIFLCGLVANWNGGTTRHISYWSITAVFVLGIAHTANAVAS
ncbi:MAG: hypothetical protein AAGJ70_05695 [Pseudomonadota bacterium]